MKEQNSLGSSILVSSYKVWRRTNLQGMLSTITHPDKDITWIQVAYFSADEPCVFSISGEVWYRGHVDGVTVYRCYDGIMDIYYGPKDIVFKWAREEWLGFVARAGEIEAARTVLLQTTALPQTHPDHAHLPA